MTRINSAIPMSALTDEHLLAEHREIKRLPSLYAKRKNSKTPTRAPETFVLGTGHVLFFVDKPLFCYERYYEIYEELTRNRGVQVDWMGANWFNNYPEEFFAYKETNYYFPTEQERDLLVERIKQRILESPKKVWHYYKQAITKEQAVEILVNNSKVIYQKFVFNGFLNTILNHE